MGTAEIAVRRQNKSERLSRVGRLAQGKFVSPGKVPDLLKRIIEPGDILALPDGSRLYVTGLTRDLTRDAPACLEVEGFVA